MYCSSNIKKQAPVGTGMSRARNSRWALHVNEAGIYGSQNKIGVLVHVYHVGIAYIHDNLSKWHMIVGAAHKVVPISENQRRKYKLNTTSIQVKHNLGRRLYGGHGENKIGGAHLGHVGIAMHA